VGDVHRRCSATTTKRHAATVIWVMNTGPDQEKSGRRIKLLADQECPWKTYLPIQGGELSPYFPGQTGRPLGRGTRSHFQLSAAGDERN